MGQGRVVLVDLDPWDPSRVLVTWRSRPCCLSWCSGRVRRPVWEQPSVGVTVPQVPGEEAPGHGLPRAQEAQPLFPLISSPARPQGLHLIISGLFIEISKPESNPRLNRSPLAKDCGHWISLMKVATVAIGSVPLFLADPNPLPNPGCLEGTESQAQNLKLPSPDSLLARTCGWRRGKRPRDASRKRTRVPCPQVTSPSSLCDPAAFFSQQVRC